MHPTRIRRSALPVALVLGLVSLAVVADTFVVPVDFPTIQEAIDAASDGDCITVEPGTYVENIDFLGGDYRAELGWGGGDEHRRECVYHGTRHVQRGDVCERGGRRLDPGRIHGFGGGGVGRWT